jgi:hypothetical protein
MLGRIGEGAFRGVPRHVLKMPPLVFLHPFFFILVDNSG